VTNDIAAATAPSDPASYSDGYLGDPAVQADWDKLYLDRDQLWSGQPNGALVAEVAGLTPGRVLDVGCGEGADAVWLAGKGWDVTALEVSGVAMARAKVHERDAGAAIRWVHAELTEAGLPAGSFDLVSAQYPALLRTPGAVAERALLAAVAPGACCCSCTTQGWKPAMTTMRRSIPTTSSGRPWWRSCSTTTGSWRSTSSGRGSHPMVARVPIMRMTWSCAHAAFVEARGTGHDPVTTFPPHPIIRTCRRFCMAPRIPTSSGWRHRS